MVALGCLERLFAENPSVGTSDTHVIETNCFGSWEYNLAVWKSLAKHFEPFVRDVGTFDV